MLDLFAYETLNDFPALNVALEVMLFNLQILPIVVPCILAILPSVSPFLIRWYFTEPVAYLFFTSLLDLVVDDEARFLMSTPLLLFL